MHLAPVRSTRTTVFSDAIKTELEKEVAGQTLAVNTVVRGVTRLASGFTPRERSMCAYMFMGPPGTGKSHVIQALARLLHGDTQRVAIVDAGELARSDPTAAFAAQLAPVVSAPMVSNAGPPPPGVSLDLPPLSIIQVEFLERATTEACTALASILETGRLTYPDGRRGILRNCMVFLTSRLCCREILDEAPQIGFSGALNEDDGDYEDRLYKLCYEEAVQKFGGDLMGQLDRFVVFHRLQEEHLTAILDRRFARLNQWLGTHRFQCELQPLAREFLLERGLRDLHLGARDLLRAHQQFVEFPVADLLISGRMQAGGSVLIDRRPEEEHLHFTVAEHRAEDLTSSPHVREIPVG